MHDDQTTLEGHPTLVVTSPGALQGHSLALRNAEQTIGRSLDRDLRLDDLSVSRRHVVVRRAGTAVVVEDDGSTAGVLVNGQRITGPVLIRPGDVLRLGLIDLRLLTPGQAPGPSPSAAPAGLATAGPAPGPPGPPAGPPGLASGPQPAPTPQPGSVRFDVGAQQGANISNVGGNQYVHYGLQIAAMRERARRLLRFGVASLLAGTAVFGYVWVRMGAQIVNWDQTIFNAIGSTSDQPPDMPQLSFAVLAWVPVALVLEFVGITLIIVSLLMKRRANSGQLGRRA